MMAASMDFERLPASAWASLAFFLFVCLQLLQTIYRFDHRWMVHRGRKNAPEVDIQQAQLREIFDGRNIAEVDPRKYTIAVARMNGIANEYGYHYIGERGNAYGSTRVAFQMLPGPLPPRVPTKSSRWRPIIVGPPPTGPHFPYVPIHTWPTISTPAGTTTAEPPHPKILAGISNLFDGQDLVRLGGPLAQTAPVVDIAYRRGYVFAWGHVPPSTSKSNPTPSFFFRRLYPAE